MSQTAAQPIMTFAEFMYFALYDQIEGYYTNKEAVLGTKGDFITAPLISSLFSSTLARQVSEINRMIPNADIMEFGPGTGQMAADILLSLEALNALPNHYYFIEISPTLSAKQQETLEKNCPHLLACCTWLNTFPNKPFSGVILGNEFLDALPVERFLFENNHFLQSYVEKTTQGWQESFMQSKDPAFLKAIDSLQQDLSEPIPHTYLSEVCPILYPTVKKLSEALEMGVLLFIDYGFGAKEYYHPDRNQGTLMCHYRHRAHSDPFIHVGEQDITAHINFTELAKIALTYGCTLGGYVTQADFLIALGILDLAEQNNLNQALINAQALKKLLLPHEMGELVKVMALTKNFDYPLSGFLKDIRHRL